MNETAEFENCRAIASTPVALCVVIDGKAIWIPQSQIHDDSEVYRTGDVGKLVVTEWIAIQKGLV